MNIFLKSLSILLILLSFIFLYKLVIRPWHSNWGATTEEIEMSLPGDELVCNPNFIFTRAITIEAKPEEIYPWIIQIGHKRAGFYSYDWFDNSWERSSERILHHHQNLKIGDKIPISNFVLMNVDSLKSDKFLTIGNGSWTWYLNPLDDSNTRLITRMRGVYKGDYIMILVTYLTELGDLPFMRKSMNGIKQRSEEAIIDSFILDLPEGLAWFLSFGAFILSVVFIFKFNRWLYHWVLALFSFWLFIGIFYWQIPLILEVFVSLLVFVAILNHKLFYKIITKGEILH